MMNLGADDVDAFTPTLNSHTKFASQPSHSVSGSNYSSNESASHMSAMAGNRLEESQKVQNHQVGESQNRVSTQNQTSLTQTPADIRYLIPLLVPKFDKDKFNQFMAICYKFLGYEIELEEYCRLLEELVGDLMIEMALREWQKVRKRKLAESSRLQNMERRQKQRVEEIRENQKKDKENVNMKEKLRAEVRLELKQLEMKCLDMGSLLRGLGVHVSGGLRLQPYQIRAAYRKALLTFHPDRVPASDIRKLVQAEEKFKLISRMKEKFCPTL